MCDDCGTDQQSHAHPRRPSMAIVPDFVLTLVNAHLTPLLDWFSDRLYVEFLKHAADHLLVQLHTRLDCRPLEQACAAFHHSRGPGTRPTHSVPRLVRALLVKALFDWSLREVEWHLRFNLIVKWFVGYRIFDAGPDHVTLERFEHWVTVHQHRAFFDEVLRQIDCDFPQEREQPQGSLRPGRRGPRTAPRPCRATGPAADGRPRRVGVRTSDARRTGHAAAVGRDRAHRDSDAPGRPRQNPGRQCAPDARRERAGDARDRVAQ